jgi:hypothetical protein
MSTAAERRYFEQDNCTYYGPDRLANFTARVVQEIVVNDFISLTRFYWIAAVHERGHRGSARVLSTRFDAMAWTSQLGPDFLVEVGRLRKQRLAYAIRSFSNPEVIHT